MTGADPDRGEAGADAPEEPRQLPPWERTEVAWPLALATGFAGTLLGLSLGIPGAPAVLATAGFWPVFIAWARRAESVQAGLLGLAWSVGAAGAVLGGAVERAEETVGAWGGLAALPLAPLAEAELLRQAAGHPLDAAALGGRIAWGAAALLVARPTRCAATLLLAALAVGAAVGGAAPHAMEAIRAGAAVPAVLLAAVPGFALLQAAGVLTAAAASLEPGEPVTGRAAWRGGVALLLAGWVLELLVGPHQAAHLASLGG